MRIKTCPTMIWYMKNYFSQIGFINLFSKHPAELRQFYRDVLGMKPLANQNEKSSWYGFKTRGATFAIEPTHNRKAYRGRNKSNALIQFKVNSKKELEILNNLLEQRGVKLIYRSKKSSYGFLTNFLDPDGNLIEVLAPIRTSIKT